MDPVTHVWQKKVRWFEENSQVAFATSTPRVNDRELESNH